MKYLLYLVVLLPTLGFGNERGFGVQLGVPLAVGRQIDGDIPFHASVFYDFYVGNILGIGGEIGGLSFFTNGMMASIIGSRGSERWSEHKQEDSIMEVIYLKSENWNLSSCSKEGPLETGW